MSTKGEKFTDLMTRFYEWCQQKIPNIASSMLLLLQCYCFHHNLSIKLTIHPLKKNLVNDGVYLKQWTNSISAASYII